MNSRPYPEPVQRTLAIAAAKGIPCEVIEHEQSGCTSEAAAKALGVDVAAVIKTLVLETDQGFAVAIIAGNKRLDFKAVAKQLGCRNVRLASPARVRELSGYDVGGVPAIVFEDRCPLLLSNTLFPDACCIGSAGDAFHGLALSVRNLVHLGYQFVEISTPGK